MEREVDRQFGAAFAVIQALYQTAVMNAELSWKAKLSIYQVFYVPTPWSWGQNMSFLVGWMGTASEIE